MEKPIEYEFTLKDGDKRYEIAYNRREVFMFKRMHKAVAVKPVKYSATTKEGG